jgi:hypothetical protein
MADGVTLSLYDDQLGTKYADVIPPQATKDNAAMESSIRPVDGESDGKHRCEIEPNCPRIVVKDVTTGAQSEGDPGGRRARRNMTPELRVASAAIRRLSSSSVGSRSTPSTRQGGGPDRCGEDGRTGVTSLRGDGDANFGGRRVNQNGRT